MLEHPFVQSLLEAAREQVRDALSRQPDGDRWLICVRTYGRAGEPLAKAQFGRFLAQNCSRDAFWLKHRMQPALARGGVDSLDSLKSALEDIPAFRQKIKKSGIKGVDYTPSGKSLEELKRKLAQKNTDARELENNVTKSAGCSIRFARGSERGVRELTLASLERALGAKEAARRCLVFVSHEDRDVTSGKYAEALKGTPWEHRVVQGIKGAHLQVRFIEEAAPVGTHVVIADDNIDDFFVECTSQETIDKRKKEGFGDEMMRPLSESFCEPPLEAGWSVVEESPLHRFFRGAFCSFTQVRRAAVTEAVEKVLASRRINDLPKLKAALAEKNKDRNQFKDALNAGCGFPRGRIMEKLLAQVGQPLPARNLLAVRKEAAAQRGPELAQLIRRAGQEMQCQGANIWGVNPSKNHYWLHGFGETVRRRAQKTGIFQDFTVRLGLVYGAFFGIRALHEQRRYTRYGQVKDDVERSLRYWHCDGVALRFQRYAAVKDRCQLVGKFHAKKGGISAGSSAERHHAEATRAMTSMLDEFASKYARLAAPGEAASCGLIWHGAGDGGRKRKRASPAEGTPKRGRTSAAGSA